MVTDSRQESKEAYFIALRRKPNEVLDHEGGPPNN